MISLLQRYFGISLSIILTSALISPVFSQTKDNRTRILVNSQVIEDKVTLRVKVNKNNKLISNLKKEDFSVYVDCKGQNLKQCDAANLTTWKNPKESSPVPSKIVILLDLSGSMKQPDTGTGGLGKQPKLQGAINAIREFTKVLSGRGGDTQMVIVPFSDKAQYTACNDYAVTAETLNRFAPATSQQHQETLQALQSELNKVTGGRKNPKSRLCGETNLYLSLAKTIDFLGNLDSQESANQNNRREQAKLHIVLLSDGFNTVPFSQNSTNICDASHFNNLNQNYLQKSIDKIQIHTIGYGRTASELGRDSEYSQVTGGKAAKCTDIEKFSDEKIREQFKSELIEQENLKKIAEITGGIPEFSGNAQEIAQKFRDILDTILGEYEMTYAQPNADTASEHSARVVINSIGNQQVNYSMPFVFQVPSNLRFWTILFSVLLPFSISTVLLYLLAANIKKQAE